MSSRVDPIQSIALTVSSIVIAAAVAHRSFGVPRAAPNGLVPAAAPTHIPEWTKVLPYGIRVGDTSAAITIVEFADLECPSCRAFHETLRELLAEHAGQIAAVYVSYPISFHRFALGAARGAECAAAVGRFTEWLDVVYRKQDSLGLKSWGSFAHEAGIRDSASLSRCAMDPRPIVRIDSGKALGREFGVTGTPTLLVNGWRLRGVPSKEDLRKVIDAVLSGKPPFRS
jgi:protein-disulfide isomerase